MAVVPKNLKRTIDRLITAKLIVPDSFLLTLFSKFGE